MLQHETSVTDIFACSSITCANHVAAEQVECDGSPSWIAPSRVHRQEQQAIRQPDSVAGSQRFNAPARPGAPLMPGTIRPRPTQMPFLLLVLALLASVPTSPVAAQTASERDDPTTGISQTSTPQTDHGIEDRLRGIFAEMEPLENIEVTVSAGVVELGGEVDSMATASRALRLAGQVDGVVDVQDSLVVDRDLDSRSESTRQTLTEAGEEILSALPLLVAALGVFILFWLLGAWLGRRQRLFGRVTPNVFIAGLLGQATHLLF